MEVVVWGASKSSHLSRLLRALKPVLNDSEFTLFGSLTSLSQYLRFSINGQSLAVLLAETRQDLEALASLGQLTHNIKLLLIIPDGEARNVFLGHTLRPRYLSYVDSDFSDVVAVLEQMLKCAERQVGYGNQMSGTSRGKFLGS